MKHRSDEPDKFKYKVKITKGFMPWALGIIGLIIFMVIPILVFYVLYTHGDQSFTNRIMTIIKELI
ncbi:MAG: hypothetical protein ACE5FU_12370, partial [Nitrospinota bacterium]